MSYPELEQIRQELKFLATPRDEQMKNSIRIKSAQRALKLLVELETKLIDKGNKPKTG